MVDPNFTNDLAYLDADPSEGMEVESLELKVEESIAEDRASLIQLLQHHPHMEAETWEEEKIKCATQIFEMFLVSGLNSLAATNKIVELFSPPRVTKRLEQLKLNGLGIGTTFDLRPNKNGDTYDLTLPQSTSSSEVYFES